MAASSQWGVELPAVPGHPGFCDPFFDVTLGQSGDVWFLAAPFGQCLRTISIPEGTWLFVNVISAEASSLELDAFFGCTAAEQGAAASYFVDFVQNPFCIIDDVALQHMERYRFTSPQFTFTAPVPNVIGVPAGTVSPCPYPAVARRYPGSGTPRSSKPPMMGKGVTDGYWAMIGPLSLGHHTIHLGGTFAEVPDFGTVGIDMTYLVTVF